MTTAMLAIPAQAAASVAQSIAGYARPLFGFGALLSLLIIFKPLVIGIMRSVVLVFNPRLTLEEREGRQRLRDLMMVNRMARECEGSQPGLAAELRSLGARD